MTFLTPLGLLGALIAIPIILLYMLRLRRREVVISSNFLWQQVVRDQEANTPWQRLKRNLLLFLQLLILALLVLALTRPAQVVPSVSAGRTVLLLDASASMSATDHDGVSRFATARREIFNIIAGMSSQDEMTIIRVAEVAEPLTSYTTSGIELGGAVEFVEVGRGGADWETALTLATAGAQGTVQFNILIATDGGIDLTNALPENVPQPIYIPVGVSSDNLAITALATRSLAGERPQLFAQVENYSAEDAEVSLVIRLDGDLWESATQTISGESQRSFIFTIDQTFSTIEAELLIDDTVTDYLSSDNSAFAVASDVTGRRVLMVSEGGNLFIDQVLRSLPGVQSFRGDANRRTLPEQEFDLYIFDNYLPDELPDGDMLIIDPPSDTDLFDITGESEQTRNIDIITRDHPLMAFLDFDAVNIRSMQTVTTTGWGTPLVGADGGELIIAGEDDGRQIVLMPFDLNESDLPLQITFPLFMANAIEWFTPTNIIDNTQLLTVGDAVPIRPPIEATRVEVVLPDGEIIPLELDDSGVLFTDTSTSGLYVVNVYNGDDLINSATFAVNLFNTGESDITPINPETLNLGGSEEVDTSEAQLGLREFWTPLAWLALMILLIEWWVYFRRLQVPTITSTLRRSTARR